MLHLQRKNNNKTDEKGEERMKDKLTKEIFKQEFAERLLREYGRSVEKSHLDEQYVVLGDIVREYATSHWKQSKDEIAEKQQKQMYYFSMEFLMGKLFHNNMSNLGIYEIVKDGLYELGIDLNAIEEIETDAGLGNGGLGRLAACFMDSLASMNYSGSGNCIRYRYGFFKQIIEDNQQREVPDLWMRLGNIWEVRKPQHTVQVRFGGQVNQHNENGRIKIEIIGGEVINAVPYDMPIVGYDTNLTNTLRLWDSEPAEESMRGDANSYLNDVNAITNCLYPDDSTEAGKRLRLKQQYFFVCAGINSMIRSHLANYPSLDNLAEKVTIQMNDTHPVMAIPELMRVLMDDYGYSWDKAWIIVCKTCAYTNHTVLAEALEKWPVRYFQELLPRIYMIIQEIQYRFEFALNHEFNRPDLIPIVSVIKEGQIHMANLAIVGSYSINGVASLHTNILKKDVFKDFYSIMPNKFNNKTNGITHRRWLMYANPQLCQLLDETIGTSWHKEPEKLIKLKKYADDKDTKDWFMEVKLERKKILAAYIKQETGIDIDVHSIIDVHAKRLHAYKRQLLNVLHIIYLYQKIKEDKDFKMQSRTFIFAAKAAPSYVFAKQVIRLINCVADVINNDADASKYMKVVFLPNYSVSMAELLVAAADVSEQISTAGKEASGTGNMKFMMNGAITLGTMDGANVEIVDKAGLENEEIFGLSADEVESINFNHSYNVWDVYNNDSIIKKAIDSLNNGSICSHPDAFKQIINDVLYNGDEYLVLKDFWSYVKAQENIEKRYLDRDSWAEMCLSNIAASGYFSSDRTIDEYVRDIWHLEKVKVK